MLRIGMVILLCFQLFTEVLAQPCTNPGQLPTSSFPVCGATIFSQAVVPVCSGSPLPTKCITTGFIYTDKNPYWYKFTCYDSGTLGFVITPNNLSDDYDWQLFDITGHQPSDVYTDTTLFVSCNWSGDTGITGASSTGVFSINCAGGGVPTFNEMPTLSTGHTYLLMISHFDNISQSGYSLVFTGGTAVITDTTASTLNTAFASCGGDTIKVVLNKKLKCSSLAADGSDFSLSPSVSQIIQAIGTNCNNGFDMDTIILIINNPLPSGNYRLTCRTGSDTNTLQDYCDAQMAVGAFVNFIVSSTGVLAIDSIMPLGCRPLAITLVLNHPVLCKSITADGSDFAITGPSLVTIDSAIFLCNSDTVRRITLLLTSPIAQGGLYTVSIQKGTDSNTLQNVCLLYATVGVQKSMYVTDTVKAQFNYILKRSCLGDSLFFYSNNNVGVTSWLWMIDTLRYSIPNPIGVFTTAGNHVILLKVSNGVCSDSSTQTIQLNSIQPLKATINVQKITCYRKKDAVLSAQVTGGIGSYTYEWLHHNLTFTGNPLINADTGKYVFTVTDSVGCKFTTTVNVTEPAILKGSVVIQQTKCGIANGTALINTSGGNPPYNYIWSTGDTAKSISNLNMGNYVIFIKDSNGCADTTQFNIATSIGVQSKVLKQTNSCRDSSTGAATVAATGNGTLTYQWLPFGGNSNNSSLLPQGNYSVIITDTVGCRDTVSIRIELLPPIQIVEQIKNVSCFNNKNGSIGITENGNGPYMYYWLHSLSANPNLTGLDTGQYTLRITDTFGCNLYKQYTITQPYALQLIINKKNTTCGLTNGFVEAYVTGGTPPYNYNWTFGSILPVATNLPPLTTDITVKDSYGCIISHYGISITPSNAFTISLGNDIDICAGDSVKLSPGIFNSYKWHDGSTLSDYVVTKGGLYSVTVKNDTGCTATASIRVIQRCADLIFPDAFTPNNDFRNDLFGPIGTLQSVKQYVLKIFNRWGNIVFTSNNPTVKWDGKQNNVDVPNGTYIWMAEYTISGKPLRSKKGTLVLIR